VNKVICQNSWLLPDLKFRRELVGFCGLRMSSSDLLFGSLLSLLRFELIGSLSNEKLISDMVNS